jgi:hypothetical protein
MTQKYLQLNREAYNRGSLRDVSFQICLTRMLTKLGLGCTRNDSFMIICLCELCQLESDYAYLNSRSTN